MMLTMFALLSYFSANTYKKGGVVNAILRAVNATSRNITIFEEGPYYVLLLVLGLTSFSLIVQRLSWWWWWWWSLTMFILHWTRLGWPGEGQQIVIANEQKNCTFSPPLSLWARVWVPMISPVSGGCQYIARDKWRKQERLWISGHSGLVGW